MSYCCPTQNSMGMPAALSTQKRIASCGNWVGFCGAGVQSIFFYLGIIQSNVTVWFKRNYAEDTLTVYQFGEPIASAPDGALEGSFTFGYAPYSNENGMDEIEVRIGNLHADSRWEIKVNCPEEINDKEIVTAPQETSVVCGRNHHQAGFSKKNTILLGDEAGEVFVYWSVQGYAEVRFYQGSTLLEHIKSNRSGQFNFFYDPAKGDVYATTEGTGTVDYIFSCPYVAPSENVERFEFTCGTGAYNFEAPNVVHVNLPEYAGAVQLHFATESTVVLNFYQGDYLVYTVQQFEGSATFSFDYFPENGNLRIESSNYGLYEIEVDCPYVEPDIDNTPTSRALSCGTAIQEFNTPSNITVSFPDSDDGQVTVNFEISGSAQLLFIYNGVVINDADLSGSFTFDYTTANTLYIEARGTGSFSIEVGCPVQPPKEFIAPCGQTDIYDGPSIITLSLGSIGGNFDISADVGAALYKNDVLQDTIGTNPKYFFYTVGDIWKVSGSQTTTLTTVCPSIKEMVCGSSNQYRAGDTVTIDLGDRYGDTTVSVTATSVDIAWYVDGSLVKTTSNSESFTLIFDSPRSVVAISSGTGHFIIDFPCPVL